MINDFGLSEYEIQGIEAEIPYHESSGLIRSWLKDEISDIDILRKRYKSDLTTIANKKEKERVKKYRSYLLKKRNYLQVKLGIQNKIIKQRNVEKHSLQPGEVNIFIEMVSLLKERSPDIWDVLYRDAKINLKMV
jgi:hypothetical protein